MELTDLYKTYRFVWKYWICVELACDRFFGLKRSGSCAELTCLTDRCVELRGTGTEVNSVF